VETSAHPLPMDLSRWMDGKNKKSEEGMLELRFWMAVSLGHSQLCFDLETTLRGGLGSTACLARPSACTHL
jgi:hypothetical protein